jgi:hypothetical protein
MKITTIHLRDEHFTGLRTITRALQDGEIPTCTNSDVIRTGLEIILASWPSNRKKIVASILKHRDQRER